MGTAAAAVAGEAGVVSQDFWAAAGAWATCYWYTATTTGTLPHYWYNATHDHAMCPFSQSFSKLRPDLGVGALTRV